MIPFMGIIGDGMGENHGIKCSFRLCQLAMGISGSGTSGSGSFRTQLKNISGLKQ